jgi:hypothetical protein
MRKELEGNGKRAGDRIEEEGKRKLELYCTQNRGAGGGRYRNEGGGKERRNEEGGGGKE